MVGLLILLSLQAAEGALPSVRCEGRGTAVGREFVLERAARGGEWQLRYRDREHPAWISLALPGARPELGPGVARLEFRNANGGRQVQVAVSPERARLDIYVDYGLDVNIDPDLDPEVDRLNTEGPLTSVACTVNP